MSDLPKDGQAIRYRRKGANEWRTGTVKLVWWYHVPIIDLEGGGNIIPHFGDEWEAERTGRQVKLSAEMRRTLYSLRRLKNKSASASDLGCSISTLMALERRGFVWIETSFENIMFPRKARAHFNKEGM